MLRFGVELDWGKGRCWHPLVKTFSAPSCRARRQEPVYALVAVGFVLGLQDVGVFNPAFGAQAFASSGVRYSKACS